MAQDQRSENALFAPTLGCCAASRDDRLRNWRNSDAPHIGDRRNRPDEGQRDACGKSLGSHRNLIGGISDRRHVARFGKCCHPRNRRRAGGEAGQSRDHRVEKQQQVHFTPLFQPPPRATAEQIGATNGFVQRKSGTTRLLVVAAALPLLLILRLLRLLLLGRNRIIIDFGGRLAGLPAETVQNIRFRCGQLPYHR